VFTANEDALVEDGPLTTLAAGSAIRVLKLDPATGKSGAQYAYQLPKIPLDKAASGSFPPDNGLPELLAVSNSEFIAIERAFADGVGNTIRLTRDNIEGISWGPRLANGNRTLVLVADNNFADNQVTQFLAFEVRP
jgi:hypothetical protein